MTLITLPNNPGVQLWGTSFNNDTVTSNTGVRLTGVPAVAYLFGQALKTVSYTGTSDGITLSDGRFVFPAGNPNLVTLTELADALRFKYGVDPIIEFAPGLALRGYSVADINRILESMSREFAGQFDLPPVDAALLESTTRATFVTENSATFGRIGLYLDNLTTKGTGLKSFYEAKLQDAQGRLDRYAAEESNPLQADEFSQERLKAAEARAQALVDRYGSYLRDLDRGLSMVTELRKSVSAGGFDFLTTLEGYRSSGITDVMAELERLNVDPSLLWDKPQSFVTFASGNPQSYQKVNLDWSKPDWNLQNLNTGLTAPQIDYVRQRFDQHEAYFGEFDWDTWKAGNEALWDKTKLTQTRNLWTQGPITAALQYGYAGYLDADLANYPRFDAALLNTASRVSLVPATTAELREDLTEGGDVYTDRFGAFYINGVRTRAMDLAVTSRVLAQENIAGEYKTLMDDLAERNNLVAAARSTIAQIDGASAQSIAAQRTALAATLANLSQQYGYDDILLEKLTAGKIYGLTFASFSDVSNYLNNLNVYITGSFLTNLQNLQSSTTAEINALKAEIAGYDAQIGPLTQQLVSSTIYRDSLVPGSFNYNQNYAGVSQSIQNLENQLNPLKVNKEFAEDKLARFEAIAAGNLEQTRVAVITRGALSTLGFPSNAPTNFDDLLARLASWKATNQTYLDEVGMTDPLEYFHLNYLAPVCNQASDASGQWVSQWDDWVAQSGDTTDATRRAYSTAAFSAYPATVRSGGSLQSVATLDATGLADLKALLNTLISNKVRDGDLDQAKLQSLTAQLQNNTEAMTALLKAFSDINAALAQALR